MSYNKNFRDTYVKLEGEIRRFTKDTRIETENEVILKELAPICKDGEGGTIRSIRFLPFDSQVKAKIADAFGDVFEGKEGAHALLVEADTVSVYADDVRGYLYGACTLRSHYEDGIEEGILYNVPLVEFRAMKVYLPAADKMDEFYYMVDMFMHYGYNAIVVELGGAMEYKKHPEINSYWVEICEEFSEYSNKAGLMMSTQSWSKNSVHIENGGGKWLSQETVREICDYCRAHGLEFIPEVPSLSHADYLMAGRSDFAERPEDPYPDTYCPSNPKSYEILFDILDEVIAVCNPRVVHIGHDETYVYGICEKCRQKSGAELYAADITKIHDYLAKFGIRTMLWAEKFLNSYSKGWWPAGGARYTYRYEDTDRKVCFRGKEYTVKKNLLVQYWQIPSLPEGTVYQTVEELYPSVFMVPKDLIAMNWYWSYYELSDQTYHSNGIPMVYGNFSGLSFEHWQGRVAAGAKGFAVSSWGASDFKQMQRGKRLCDMVYSARMAWSRDYDETKKSRELSYTAADAFKYRNREVVKGSYIDVLHTTDIEIKHGYFGCGDFLDDNMFRLGYYHIYFKDGTDKKVEILWGENVGPMHEQTADGTVVGFEEDGNPISLTKCCETVFTCDFEDKEGKRYYRFLIPTDREVLRVEPEIFPEYQEHLLIDSVKINNK